jgi:hypothetical protein
VLARGDDRAELGVARDADHPDRPRGREFATSHDRDGLARAGAGRREHPGDRRQLVRHGRRLYAEVVGLGACRRLHATDRSLQRFRA